MAEETPRWGGCLRILQTTRGGGNKIYEVQYKFGDIWTTRSQHKYLCQAKERADILFTDITLSSKVVME